MTATGSKPTTALATTKPSAINLMAARMNVEPGKLYDTLKKTVFAKASNEELLALVVIANTYGLNPFLKEIYAFPSKGDGITPIVSVDGWNSMLVRQPDFDGIEFEFAESEDGKPFSCTATIYCKSRKMPVKITEYFSECKRNTDPWNTMPHRMLRNRTLCQAARVAFGFSGIKHDEEIGDVQIESNVLGTTTPPAGQLAAPPEKIVTSDSKTPQKELEAIVVTAGFTFDVLQKWGLDSGNIENADSLAGFDEIDTATAKRLLKAQAGLLKGLDQTKRGFINEQG